MTKAEIAYFIIIVGTVISIYGAVHGIGLDKHLIDKYKKYRIISIIFIASDRFYDEKGAVNRKKLVVFLMLGLVLCSIGWGVLCIGVDDCM